jgi:hypothetical protein
MAEYLKELMVAVSHCYVQPGRMNQVHSIVHQFSVGWECHVW